MKQIFPKALESDSKVFSSFSDVSYRGNVMQTKNLHTRIMLQQYEVQLLTARRLARHRRKQRMEEGENAKPTVDPSITRKLVVQRVARELYDTLLSTGSENPMVETIVKKLSAALGTKVLFQYPTPAPLQEEHLRLLRAPDAGESLPMPFTEEENMEALHLLWEIVLTTVEENTI